MLRSDVLCSITPGRKRGQIVQDPNRQFYSTLKDRVSSEIHLQHSPAPLCYFDKESINRKETGHAICAWDLPVPIWLEVGL